MTIKAMGYFDDYLEESDRILSVYDASPVPIIKSSAFSTGDCDYGDGIKLTANNNTKTSTLSEEALDTIRKYAFPESYKNKKILAEAVQKTKYTLQECLDTFVELNKKELGPIYLSGSVSLVLQGLIKREYFSDLDVVVEKLPELDDDMIDNYRGSRQRFRNIPIDVCNSKSVFFENMPIDIFINPTIRYKKINYRGNEYLCQDYKDILNVKLKVALSDFKDADQLIGSIININIK